LARSSSHLPRHTPLFAQNGTQFWPAVTVNPGLIAALYEPAPGMRSLGMKLNPMNELIRPFTSTGVLL
jgi:hypothetical protein